MFKAGLILIVTLAVTAVEQPVVHVEQGTLRGNLRVSAGGNTFAAFEGIPYAHPPIGEYRFKEPKPAEPWKGVWEATQLSGVCMQYGMHSATPTVSGDEDCLYINIYTPQLPTEDVSPNLDVIMHIHGGGFTFGSGVRYGPRYLMDHATVLVTFNYRLGILGFLSTEDEVVPGNNGLKDQVIALRWVQKNIAAFGGNPDSVTISGNSAGGASVHYHYLSPMSRGLFHKGISLAGTALMAWSQAEALRSKTNKVGAALGCNTTSSQELVDCLRQRPAKHIVHQIHLFQKWLFNPFTPFGPTIEVAGPEPFLSKQPIDIILEGGAQNLPWLTAVTTGEGLYPAADFVADKTRLRELDQHFIELAPYILDFNYTVPKNQQQEVSGRIREYYLGNKSISVKTTKEVIQMIGDRLFVADGERTAKLHAKVNSAPVYFYQFSYRGKHSLTEILSGTDIDFGVSHADDTAYVIQVPYCYTEETQEDRNMSRLLIDIWTHFASKGDPTPRWKNVSWEPVPAEGIGIKFLHIASSTDLKMLTRPELGHRHFWDSLPFMEPQFTASQLGRLEDEL